MPCSRTQRKKGNHWHWSANERLLTRESWQCRGGEPLSISQQQRCCRMCAASGRVTGHLMTPLTPLCKALLLPAPFSKPSLDSRSFSGLGSPAACPREPKRWLLYPLLTIERSYRCANVGSRLKMQGYGHAGAPATLWSERSTMPGCRQGLA